MKPHFQYKNRTQFDQKKNLSQQAFKAELVF